MARRIEVELIGDSRSLERAFARSERAGKQFNRSMSRQAKAFAGGLGLSPGQIGAAGAAVAIKHSITAASDLNEQLSKTNVVFGKSVEQVKAWSETTTEAFGVSRREALATAGSFGALLRPIGLTGQAAAQQSERLTQLGADLASFYNTSVADSLDAIRSGIVGESEPLRRYGVLLSETRVQQEALRQTGKKHVADLTAQEKVLARIAIIYGDTSQAQGDFARTQGGLANQTRKLTAEVDDLAVTLGQVLIPAATEATKAMNKLLGAWKNTLRGPQPGQSLHEKDKGFLSAIGLTPILGQFVYFKKNLDVVLSGIDDSVKHVNNLGTGLASATALLTQGQTKQAEKFLPSEGFNPAASKAAAAEAKRAAARRARAPGQRNTWFDTLIGRELVDVQDIRSAKGQVARLKEIAAQVTAEIAHVKDVTRKQNLLDQLKDIARRSRSIQAAAAAAAAQARDEQKLRDAEAKQAAADRRQAARERALGWLDLAVRRADVTKGLKDDLKTRRDRIAFIKQQIKTQGLTLDYANQLFDAQQDLADTIKNRRPQTDPLAGLMQVGSSSLARILAAGTGLGVAGRRTLASNIAGAEIRPITVPVNIDGREVGRAVSKDQNRTGRRTASQTSGRRG